MLLSYMQSQSMLLFSIEFWTAFNYLITVLYTRVFLMNTSNYAVPFILCSDGAFTNCKTRFLTRSIRFTTLLYRAVPYASPLSLWADVNGFWYLPACVRISSFMTRQWREPVCRHDISPDLQLHSTLWRTTFYVYIHHTHCDYTVCVLPSSH